MYRRDVIRILCPVFMGAYGLSGNCKSDRPAPPIGTIENDGCSANALMAATISIDEQTAKSMAALEERITCELQKQRDALNNMPQRLLSDEVQTSLKGQLQQQFNAQIEAVRKDLQEQIDKMKSKFSTTDL